MTQKIDLQPAYILHTRDYRDTSLLIDCLTLDYGVIRAVARGVRGSRGNRRALLQPLQPLLISYTGKGELKSLVQAEAAAPVFTLDGNRLFSAIYVNELLCRLVQAHEPHPHLYRLYQAAMLSLMHHRPVETVLRRFEFSLLTELGYAPDMQRDAENGQPLQAGYLYTFDSSRGFVSSATDRFHDPAALFNGADIAELGTTLLHEFDQPFDQDLLNPAKRFMRLALRPLLGSKPLNSRKLFVSKNRLATACLPPGSNKW